MMWGLYLEIYGIRDLKLSLPFIMPIRRNLERITTLPLKKKLEEDFFLTWDVNNHSTQLSLSIHTMLTTRTDQQRGFKFFWGDKQSLCFILLLHNFKFSSLSETGPWQQVLDETLEDSRSQNDPLPLQTFNFDPKTAKYAKFKLLSYWGNGGGLQYFKIKKAIRQQGKFKEKRFGVWKQVIT